MKLISLSYKITHNFPSYPGDYPLSLAAEKTHDKDGYHLSILKQSLHTGTHIDLPNHMIKSHKTFEDYPLTRFINQAVLIENHPEECDKIIENHMVFIKTNHVDLTHKDYFDSYPEIHEKIIETCIKKNVPILGIDTPSPDYAPFNTHKRLFEADILIIENLNNLSLLPKHQPFKVYAIPLNLDAEASPIQVVVEINDLYKKN
ncbi:cyclase family protein [Liberiplasma polymorphum]|uniref:cyclase family protein n=1 Tax=Liberiplasma polymorphum TaxID=3374570 RepID=UPI0037722BB2